MIYPFNLPPARDLKPGQLDGWDCVYCGGQTGAMQPVGLMRGAQVFAHPQCAEPHRITP